MKKPEILAPAGSYDAFLAAVANGADAVYLGGKQFSARQSAANFSEEELKLAVEYGHLHGVKLFVTMNTLVDNGEMADALKYLSFLYEIGIDAVILQDIGLLYHIRTYLPEMPIFASTQMSIYNLDGVKFLAQLGMKRIILARELSLKQIKEICDASTIDIEIFAHGALCICYSGQCLMSSMIGSRSGNRGKCAQPCRLEYELVDGKGQVLSQKIGAHLLSPKDLNTYDILPKVLETGVRSLKIEGRMKRPEYVGTVVKIYREALDLAWQNRPYEKEEAKNQLAQAFNRQFTTAFLEQNQGQDMMSFSRPNNRGVFLGRIEKINSSDGYVTIKLAQSLCVGDGVAVWVTKGGREGFVVEEILQNGRPIEQGESGSCVQIKFPGKAFVGDRIFKTSDAKLLQAIMDTYRQTDRIPLHFQLEAKIGEPLKVQCCDEQNHQVEYISDFIVVAAQKQPTTAQRIEEQLGRLGGSYFYFAGVDIVAEENIMLPASVLNQCRRELVEQIKQARLAKFARVPLAHMLDGVGLEKFARSLQVSTPKEKRNTPPAMPKLAVLVGGYSQGEALAQAGADFIYAPGQFFRPELPAKKEMLCRWAEKIKKDSIPYISLPRVYHNEQSGYYGNLLKEIKNSEIAGVLVPNLSGFQLLKEVDWQKEILGDWSLNVFNHSALLQLSQWGVKRAALSLELSLRQIEKFPASPMEKEVTVFGPMELMVSEYCVLGAVLGGRSAASVCTKPCMEKNSGYGLKDKAGFTFPVEVDECCRSHIFNSRDLCIVKELADLWKAGITVFRLDLRRYSVADSVKILEIYRDVLSQLPQGQKIDSEKYMALFQKINTQGFTKGHFYRGVL